MKGISGHISHIINNYNTIKINQKSISIHLFHISDLLIISEFIYFFFMLLIQGRIIALHLFFNSMYNIVVWDH